MNETPPPARSAARAQPALMPSALDFRYHVQFRAEEFRDGTSKNILFVVPPGTLEMNFGKLSAAGAELPWLGMAHVAAAARAAGHRVHLRDYEVLHQDYSQVAADIRRIEPHMVATAVFINNVDRCLEVCKIAKAVNPKTKTVLGGPQATTYPEEFGPLQDVDFILISESEVSFSRLAAYCEDPSAYKDMLGVCWRDNDGSLIRNERQPLIEDIDCLPLPALDLYPMHLYYPPVYIWGKRVANMITSRGCPYECTFCEAKLTFGRTHRFHSEERVLADMDYLNKKYGYDSFQFYDDIFTVNRQRVVKLCNLLLDSGRRYKWMCYTRTDLVDQEILSLMKEAGCYQISYGPESGNQEMLDGIRKKLTVADNYRGIQLTNQAGILSVGTLMLGLPGETKEQTERTIDFAINSQLDYAIFGVTEPYPGTEMWRDCLKLGYFIDADDEHANHLLPNFSKIWVPNGRMREELETYVQEAYRRFYLRPRIIWKWLRNFAHIPPGRSIRYLWAGMDYLVLDQVASLLEKAWARLRPGGPAKKGASYRGRGYRW